MEQNSGVLYGQLTPANIPEPWKKQCHSIWIKLPKLKNHHMKNQNTIPIWIPSWRKDLPLLKKTHSFLFSIHHHLTSLHHTIITGTSEILKRLWSIYWSTSTLKQFKEIPLPLSQLHLLQYLCGPWSLFTPQMLYKQINLWSQCLATKTVRASSQIFYVWQH